MSLTNHVWLSTCDIQQLSTVKKSLKLIQSSYFKFHGEIKMIEFIKHMFGYKSFEQHMKEYIEDTVDKVYSRNSSSAIASDISRCIIDIGNFKPVAIAVEKRTSNTYLRIDRLDADSNIVHTFYDYSPEDHERIMKEFQEYLNTQSTKQIVA